nr:hypothetical protein [uncultured Caproiciproducens sp.]
MIRFNGFWIDDSKAKDSWPKRITNLDELPVYYHDFVRDWLQQGMVLPDIILVKQTNKWENDRPEYAIAQYQDCIMLLRKTGNNQVLKTVIRGNDVISVEYNQIYLDCTVIVTFLQSGEFHKAQFHFNAATKNLYVSTLNILLGNKTDYLEDVGTHENSVCSDLMGKSYLMLNYSKLAYRMDDKIEQYYWDKMETAAQKKMNKKTKKRKLETEFFIALMNKGTAIVKASKDHISAYYLCWSRTQQISLSTDQSGEYFIKITTIANDCFCIPVQQKNYAAAQNFINQCLKRTVLKF